MCVAPATCPATIREFVIFLSARPAKGFPLAVEIDISTMHLVRSVSDPEDVAWDAEDGRMMCRPS